MSKKRTVTDVKVCPDCFCPTELFGKLKNDMWRCVNPLCKNSKEGTGLIAGEKRINASDIKFVFRGRRIFREDYGSLTFEKFTDGSEG